MIQTTIFDMLYPKYKITKPIRLIELFGGYGSQALALKYLGVKFEHWKLVEWAVKSIQAYKDIHFTDDNTDYSERYNKDYLVDYLHYKGISSNYNEPMDKSQIKRLSEKQLRTIYSNIKATHNLVNIQQVKGKDLEITDTDKYCYIMTYSFPCQDLSLAGKGKGMSDTSTRSGMLWEVERILTECKELGSLPQCLIMENVVQVHGEGNVEDFNKWQLRLEELGYKNYWQDLIATDYGIPQTRNRCFMVSILGDYSYSFPPKQPLKLRLKDMLEDNVDEKYFLSDKQIESLENGNYNASKPSVKLEITDKGLCQTLDTMTGGNRQPFVRIEEKYYLSNKMIDYITSKDDKYKVNENNLIINRNIACSKTTREGNTRADTSDYICRDLPENTNILKIKNATKQGYLEATDGDGIDISSRMQHHRGTVQKGKAQTLSTMGGENVGVVINMKTQLCNDLIQKGKVKENDVIRHSYSNSRMKDWETRSVEQNNISPTLDTRCDCLGVVNNMRIRKLTPKECFRLMGVKDEDYEKCAKNQSNASLYHLAGDSIVINVIEAIIKELI